MHKRVVFYLTLISIVTTSAAFGGFTRINAPNPDDPMDVHIYQLDNGLTSIVYQELRETRALAYSPYAEYLQGKRINDPNVLWAYIGCQADKTPEAVAALVNLIDNLQESSDGFNDAKTPSSTATAYPKSNFANCPLPSASGNVVASPQIHDKSDLKKFAMPTWT